MNLIQRPTDLISQMRGEMDRLFQRFQGNLFGDGGWPIAGQVWAPQVDLEETDKSFIVKVDLPGVEPKEVEVTFQDGALILQGEKKLEREESKKNYHVTERFVGKFYRSIPLPSGIDADQIQASSANGVLTVTVPKRPDAQPKKIPIRS
ncbi:MAG: Hsp20/alpha crystallin family protein [Gemmataceae bacterium]